MSFERSHGKLRLARPRLREATAPTADEPLRDRDALGRFATGNGAARNRTAKRSLTAALRAAAATAAAEVAQSSQIGARAAQHALALYRAEARALVVESAMVRSHLLRWAVNTALALELQAAAVEQGPDTEQGLRLLERAHACEGRAERASVAAVTFASALGGRSRARSTVADRVLLGADDDHDPDGEPHG
jgi:hypothetical protein